VRLFFFSTACSCLPLFPAWASIFACSHRVSFIIRFQYACSGPRDSVQKDWRVFPWTFYDCRATSVSRFSRPFRCQPVSGAQLLTILTCRLALASVLVFFLSLHLLRSPQATETNESSGRSCPALPFLVARFLVMLPHTSPCSPYCAYSFCVLKRCATGAPPSLRHPHRLQ